jgi:hypothetical protein
MSDEIRKARTHGLRERLDPADRGHLLQIRFMPGYEVLLDLIEMACIEQETRLINVPVEDESTIVAEHKMAKAFWQVFQALQRKVNTEVNFQMQLEEESKVNRDDLDNFDEAQRILRP